MGRLRGQRITYGVKALTNLEIDADKDWAGKKITNLGAPTNDEDAATKKYIDDRMQMGATVTDASGNKTVTFSKAFPSTPKVFLQGVDAAAKGIVLDVVSVSTTQAVIKARKITEITSGAANAHRHNLKQATGSSGDLLDTIKAFSAIGGGGGFIQVGTSTDEFYSDEVAAHGHSVNAPVLAIDFNWLAVLI